MAHASNKQRELQMQHDRLGARIKNLRAAYTNERDLAIRLQLKEQLEQAEAVQQEVARALVEEKGRPVAELPGGDLPEPLRQRVPKWTVYSLQVIGLIVTLSEFMGVLIKGFRFLGAFAGEPLAVFGAVAFLTVLIWSGCLFVLLKKQQGRSAWQERSWAFSPRLRTWARVLVVANAAATLGLTLGILRYDIIYAQPPAPGQLGIVVAQFGTGVEIRDSVEGAELSAFVARNLRREIELLPGLAGNVTVVSGPLIRSVDEAKAVAAKNGATLVIWGWVSSDNTFVPNFTFVEPAGAEIGLKEVPAWYEVEINGGGTLQLSQTVARRTSGLIEYIVGLIYLNQGDYEWAADQFRQAIALTEEALDSPATEHEQHTLDRTLAIYHLALGRTYAAQEYPDGALVEYETAADYDAGYGPIYIGIGNIDYSARRCQEALPWYAQAVRLTAANRRASAYYSRGNAYFCLGQYEAAAADYQQAISMAEVDDKRLALYHHVLGVTLCQLGRFEEGLAELAVAQQLAETDSDLQQGVQAEVENCRARQTRAAATVTPTPFPTQFPTAKPTRPLPPTTPAATLFPTSCPTAPAPTPTAPPPTTAPTLFPTARPPSTVPPTTAPTLFPTALPEPTAPPPTTAPTLFPTEPPATNRLPTTAVSPPTTAPTLFQRSRA
ncbi:MAG: tetratricopeptide repeat protein [Anaerolineae bacterium]|nr:tetratricopeptide repeat protein [Anaerolineae bacterium]